jgi:hypothetical protein
MRTALIVAITLYAGAMRRGSAGNGRGDEPDAGMGSTIEWNGR